MNNKEKIFLNKLINKYSKELRDVEGLILPSINEQHSLHLYVVRLKLELWQISRNEFIEKMNEKGIGLAVHYKPIHQLSYYKKMYNLKRNASPRFLCCAIFLSLYQIASFGIDLNKLYKSINLKEATGFSTPELL